ncbi:hypothetical protein C8F01DRAFT_1249530 [Mycena amicta]|nr:hypothetical protein C8F01DRAFT_1249530 [Mycena amicta]
MPDPTLTPTKGSTAAKPLNDDHVEELIARAPAQKRASAWEDEDDEVEIVGESISIQTRRKRARTMIPSSDAASTSARQTTPPAADTPSELAAELAVERGRTAQLKDFLEHLKEVSRAKPAVPPQREPTADELKGSRYFPDGFPTRDSLYSNQQRPHPLENVLPIYKCVCCDKVKSHPVWFPYCRHSACYVCTFMHLEHSWGCPECARPMHEPPRRDYALEEEIRRHYPAWIDHSTHRYSFNGFNFPRYPVQPLDVTTYSFTTLDVHSQDTDTDGYKTAANTWDRIKSYLTAGAHPQRCTSLSSTRASSACTSLSSELGARGIFSQQCPVTRSTTHILESVDTMGRLQKHKTLEEKLNAAHTHRLAYEQTPKGQIVRAEGRRMRGKRKVAKRHISRLSIPDLVEDWGCADLRTDKPAFRFAQEDDFDLSTLEPWLASPPFNQSAIARLQEPASYAYTYTLTCAIDGYLLRQERTREESERAHQASGKKKALDRWRKDVQDLLAEDWVRLWGFREMYKPGTREHQVWERQTSNERHTPSLPFSKVTPMDSAASAPVFQTRFFNAPAANYPMLSRQTVLPEPELPCGDETHCILNASRDAHFRASLLGRIAGVVTRAQEKYIILAPVNHAGLDSDFKVFIDALRAVEDKYQLGHIKRTDSWVSPGIYEPSGLVYIHLTGQTSITTHACTTIHEDWIEMPGGDLRALDVGAVVFCVGYLLRIKTTLRAIGEDSGVLGLHYIIKASFISRIHAPTEELTHSSLDMVEFLATGSLPGQVIPAHEPFPMNVDATRNTLCL